MNKRLASFFAQDLALFRLCEICSAESTHLLILTKLPTIIAVHVCLTCSSTTVPETQHTIINKRP